MRFIKGILGFCDHCGKYFKYPKKRRMNTCYSEEESNYCHVCKSCFDEIEEYWEERWDEYNSQRY